MTNKYIIDIIKYMLSRNEIYAISIKFPFL